MLHLLRDKKVIFFDVGYTLDAPASGDWMLTGKFLDTAGRRLRLCSADQVGEALEAGLRFLMENHLIMTVEAEIRQFTEFYSMISGQLDLGLSGEEAEEIARDRACNMKNYIPYPGITQTLAALSKTHRLGIISDTWPSIIPQLEYLGVRQYLSFSTFSCDLGTFKPDRRMYLDALKKSGVSAEETAFIDDSVRNLEGAAALGITPILMAANPASDVETSYLKIRDLRELIRQEG